jgi:hypothetical protein
MDQLTAALIRAAPEGERAVLNRLLESLETSVTLPCDRSDIHVNLTWRNGRVTGVFHHNQIRAWQEVLELRASLPQSIVEAAVGLPISSIAELPFAFDAVVETVEETEKGWLQFTFVQKCVVIDAETGALRPSEI